MSAVLASAHRGPDPEWPWPWGQPRAFGTKAETLAFLGPRISAARVLPLFAVRRDDWDRSERDVLQSLFALNWAQSALIVRSSALCEDSQSTSYAGAFDSILNVVGPAAMRLAIGSVFTSYGNDDPAQLVLIQPMLDEVAESGVVFSRDPSTGAPVFVINAASGSDTQAVTGGRQAPIRHSIVSRAASRHAPEPQRPILRLIENVEALTGSDCIDIEYAITKTGAIYLLQARPLVMQERPALDDASYNDCLGRIQAKIQAQAGPHPFLYGRRTVYGIMPDWNPAEVIGTRPRPLAMSLYKSLVTDSIWAYQRHNYGYRNLRSFPLMQDFFGVPYIDVRVSFNSFLPNDLPDELATRLADHYIDSLVDQPALHDKVEFEIIFSCYTFDLPERLETLRSQGFTSSDLSCLSACLQALTYRIIDSETGLWRQDLAKLDQLTARFDALNAARIDPVSRIYWLLEDCKRYGTLPFAGLARAGFIAVQLLKSLVSVGVLTEQNYQEFLGSLETVSTDMSRDLQKLPRADFLARYGHLRPGTYDIRTQRYDAAPDTYFNWARPDRALEHPEQRPFSLTLRQMNAIERLLKEHPLSGSVIALFNFLKAAIEGREKAKFLFTRNLSAALEELACLGEAHGFSRDDVSFLDIGTIASLYASAEVVQPMLARSIAEGRARHERTCALVLPPLITAPEDVWAFDMGASAPNFITLKAVEASVAQAENVKALPGAIVMIPNADPGYDWLFSHNIAGLITAYGGANSHMAIRAGELQIPSVIGAGAVLFQEWSKARRLSVDCANRLVIPLA